MFVQMKLNTELLKTTFEFNGLLIAESPGSTKRKKRPVFIQLN